MSEVALAETQTDLEPQEATPAASQTERGTEAPPEPQATQEPPESQSDDYEDTDLTELLSTERSSLSEAERQAIRREERANARQATAPPPPDPAANYGAAMRAAREALVADGYSEADATVRLQAIETYHSQAAEGWRRQGSQDAVAGVYANLPEDQRDHFTEVARNKPADEYFREFIEHAWRNAEGLKELTLDDAINLSPKLKADVASLRVAEYKRGRTKGQSDPAGHGASNENAHSTASRPPKTKAEARTLHARGELSNAQMRQINADPSIPGGY